MSKQNTFRVIKDAKIDPLSHKYEKSRKVISK